MCHLSTDGRLFSEQTEEKPKVLRCMRFNWKTTVAADFEKDIVLLQF